MIGVVGDGWSALGAVGFLVKAGKDVCWVTGTGARLTPPLPMVETGTGAQAWAELGRSFGVDFGAELPGSFTREFRNKSFREPIWMKAPDLEARQEVLREALWPAERVLVGVSETRFETKTLGELEEDVRNALGDEKNIKPGQAFRRIEGVPVESFASSEGRLTSIRLASGEEIPCESVIFADSWEDLPRIGGLPKGLPFARRREPIGALQATFQHSRQIGAECPILEGFFSSFHRETTSKSPGHSDGEFDRHVWGHFSSDGLRSHWTLCLTENEIEDNHEIMKRLRRMKNTIEKMFVGPPWLSAETPSFLASIESEQVRFSEGVIFATGDAVDKPIQLAGLKGLSFITDGYGPARAMELARMAAGERAELQSTTQAEAADSLPSAPKPDSGENADL